MVGQIDRFYVKAAGTRSAVRLLSYALFEGRPATTRGQWFNGVVSAHLRYGLRTQHEAPFRPIFILGVGRSGTTLLGRMLGVHPQVGFLNEPKAMWHLIDPLEDVSGAYQRSGPAYFRRTPDDVTDDMRERANRLYGYYQWISRSERVVDKYCELTYRRAYLRALFPDCVLIGIIRRPQAVAQSVADWCTANGSATEDWWGVRGRKWDVLESTMVPTQPDAAELKDFAIEATDDKAKAYLEWVVGNRALLADEPGGELNHLLRYEDLVVQPERSVSDAMKNSGLSPTPSVTKFASKVARQNARQTAETAAVPVALKDAIDELLICAGYEKPNEP